MKNSLDEEDRVADVCIVGTGLSECLAAAAFALRKKKVLQVDRSDHYGDSWSSYTLKGLLEWSTELGGCLDDDNEPPVDSHSAGSEGSTAATENELKFLASAKVVDVNQWNSQRLEKRDVSDFSSDAPAADFSRSCYPVRRVLVAPLASDSDTQEATVEELNAAGGRFNFDLQPRLLFSRSPIVDLLISSGTSRYIDFRAIPGVDMIEISADSQGKLRSDVHPLPVSKAAIFEDASLSGRDKRGWMKFFMTHAPAAAVSAAFASPAKRQFDNTDKTLILEQDAKAKVHSAAADEDEWWTDLLEATGLSQRLREWVTYGICLADKAVALSQPCAAGIVRWTAPIGLARIGQFVSSLGKYTPSGALLFPIYGIGDIPQAFARACALYRGTYMLRTGVRKIVFGSKQNEDELLGPFPDTRPKERNKNLWSASAGSSGEEQQTAPGYAEKKGGEDGLSATDGAAAEERAEGNPAGEVAREEEEEGKGKQLEGEVQAAEDGGPCADDEDVSKETVRVSGVVLSTGDFVRTKNVLFSSESAARLRGEWKSLPAAENGLREMCGLGGRTREEQESRVARMIVVTKVRILSPTHSPGWAQPDDLERLGVLPPNEVIGNRHPIHVLHLSSSSACCPTGYFLTHFSTHVDDSADAPGVLGETDEIELLTRCVTEEERRHFRALVRLVASLLRGVERDLKDILLVCPYIHRNRSWGTAGHFTAGGRHVGFGPDPSTEPLTTLEVPHASRQFVESCIGSVEDFIPRPEHVAKEEETQTQSAQGRPFNLLADFAGEVSEILKI